MNIFTYPVSKTSVTQPSIIPEVSNQILIIPASNIL